MRTSAVAATPVHLRGLRAGVARSIRHAERVAIVASLSEFAGSLPFLMNRATEGLGLGGVNSSDRPAILLTIYLLSASALLLRPGAALKGLSRNVPTLLLTAGALLSYAWSEAPALTLKRSAMLIAMTLFGVYLATRSTRRDFLILLAWTFGIIAVSSALTILFMPERGINSGIHAGAWQGIYGNKNALGLTMGLGTIVFVTLARDDTGVRWGAWLGAGLCALLTVFSRSTTALIATASVGAMFPVLHLLRQRSARSILLGVIGLLLAGSAAIALFTQLDVVLAAVGKSPTISGRIPVWGYLLERVQERPWLGYGYNAFWVGWERSSGSIRDVTGWQPAHAHNGILQLCLELGVVGVVLFVVGYLYALGRAIIALRSSATGEGFWPLGFLGFLLLASQSESMVLRHDDIFWLLYVATVLLPVRAQAARRETDGAPQYRLALAPQERGRGHSADGRSERSTRIRPARPGISLGVRRHLRGGGKS